MAAFYVNTASTAGTQDGTTRTPGNSGTAAFATMLQAINSFGGSLSAQTTLYCEGSAADTSNVDQTPWDFTTTATNYLLIVGEQSYLHPGFSLTNCGKFTTTKYRLTATNRNVLYNNIPSHLRITGLQIHLTESDTASYVGLKLSNANQTAADGDQRAYGNILRCTRTSGASIGLHARDVGSGATTVKFFNNIVYNFQQGYESDANFVTELYNNTFEACEFGVICDVAAQVLARNTICASSSSGDWVGTFHANSRNNSSTDGSHPGTNGQTGTPSFVDTADSTKDLHLQSGDTVAKNNGMTDPASGLYDTDIDGGTRVPSWDIGADEQGVQFVATAPNQYPRANPQLNRRHSGRYMRSMSGLLVPRRTFVVVPANYGRRAA
jgi:hypothetical protein